MFESNIALCCHGIKYLNLKFEWFQKSFVSVKALWQQYEHGILKSICEHNWI